MKTQLNSIICFTHADSDDDLFKCYFFCKVEVITSLFNWKHKFSLLINSNQYSIIPEYSTFTSFFYHPGFLFPEDKEIEKWLDNT